MRVDKKARGASLRFVVLDGLGNPTILTDPDQAWLDAAWAAVSGGAPHDDPGAQRPQPRPARPPRAGEVRHDHLRRARRAGRGDRARDGRGGAGPPDRRRGRDAALDPRGLRRRRPGADQPRRLVAHLGGAAGRPGRAERPAGRGAHHQHPRPRGVPAPLLRLRRGRRRDRRPRRERLHPGAGLAGAARACESRSRDGAAGVDGRCRAPPRPSAGWTPSWSPTCSTCGT